jgi:hypothetical protein
MQDNEPKKKHRPGLHKQISSIFAGVPFPGRDRVEQPSGTAAPSGAEQGPAGALPPESRFPMGKPRPARQPITKVTAVKSYLQKTWQRIKDKLLKPQEGVSSSKQKIMLILIPVLIIVLIFVLMPFFKTPSREIPEPKGVKPTEVATELERKINWQIPEPYPAGLRNPMQPGASTLAKPGATKTDSERMAKVPVKGIVYSEDNPAAVVGTQLVHEGDIISDVTIVKINQDSVEFQINSKKWIQRVE